MNCIKVDKGLKPIPGSEEESYTDGLDGIGERLDEYRNNGAEFTKWRGVINIGQDIPSMNCIKIWGNTTTINVIMTILKSILIKL